jgi:hypothetical protein
MNLGLQACKANTPLLSCTPSPELFLGVCWRVGVNKEGGSTENGKWRFLLFVLRKGFVLIISYILNPKNCDPIIKKKSWLGCGLLVEGLSYHVWGPVSSPAPQNQTKNSKLSNDLLIWEVQCNCTSSYFSWFYSHFVPESFKASMARVGTCLITTYWMTTLSSQNGILLFCSWFSCKLLLGLSVLRY